MLTITKKTSRRELADEIGRITETVKTLNEQLRLAKKEVERRGLHSLIGDDYAVTRTVVQSERLDTKLIREEMPELWVKRHTIVATSNRYGVEVLTEDKEAA